MPEEVVQMPKKQTPSIFVGKSTVFIVIQLSNGLSTFRIVVSEASAIVNMGQPLEPTKHTNKQCNLL